MTAYLLLATLLVALIVSVVASAVRDRAETDEEEGVPTAEAREREAIEALRELEFDYETGVVSEEEYRRRRPELAREAVDAHQDAGPAGVAAPDAASGPARAGEAAAAEAGEAAAAEAGEPAAAPAHCTSCGAELRRGARFCARCGAPVAGRGGEAAGAGGEGR
ncbi:MAG TPA: zinc ribbon domain-containing protein [Gemmatimonadota bacterium]|nr:zinc ribbon domain-containing protein [Gemmatimonadota bacterium]